MAENPANHLMLHFNRSEDEIPLHSESPGRPSDIMYIEVGDRRGNWLPSPIRHRMMQKRNVHRCRHEALRIAPKMAGRQGRNPENPRLSAFTSWLGRLQVFWQPIPKIRALALGSLPTLLGPPGFDFRVISAE